MTAGKNIESVFGLTPLQEGILFHSLQSTDPGVYLGQYSSTLLGPLDPDNLESAWQQVVARHTTLRTLFAWRRQKERPLQVVRERVVLPWQYENWESLDTQAQSDKWQTLLDDQRARGFKLDKAPLFRLALIRIAPDKHRLLFSYHHLLFDGWSLRLLLDEVAKIYAAKVQNEIPELNTPGRFEDYVQWLDSKDWQDAEQYWAERLKDFAAPTPLQLPGPDPEKDDYPFGFRAVARELSPALLKKLEQFARTQRVTLSAVFTGAWSLLISRYADHDDVVFGSAQAGRPTELDHAQQTVGLFINTTVVRAQVQSDARLGDWLRSLQQEQVEAQEHQHLPLTKAQNVSGVPAGKPLFESLLVYQGVPATEVGAHPWQTVEEVFLEYGNYPLALLARPGTPFMLTAVHDLSKIETTAAERLLGHFEQILKSIAEDPGAADQSLCDIDLLPISERRLLLQDWSGASGSQSESDVQPVHIAIEAVGSKTPDAIALVQGAERITYGTLLERADELAKQLQERGLGAGGFGAIFLERSPDAVITILAVLKAGAAYVPLSPDFPPTRTRAMLDELAEEARVQGNQLLVISDSQHSDRLPGGEFEVLKLGEIIAVTSDSLAASVGTPDSLAYVMYTSGSTGEPKGVMVTHRNLSTSTRSRSDHYPEAPGNFLLLSPLASDSSVAGLFWALSSGGTLVLPRSRQEQALHEVVEIIHNNQVTHLLTLPSLWALLLENAKKTDLNALRCAIVAGEACHKSVILAHRQLLPDVPLYNEYGPSEAAVWSTLARLDNAATIDQVPIGYPISNRKIYVLDSKRRLAPPGQPGELCIGGAGISRGYLARPELTRERFIAHDPGDGEVVQLYCTGDRGRFLADGQLSFIGRVDTQLKVRGFRVEPEEIEKALCTHPAIREAAVMLVPSNDTDSADPSEQLRASRLVAYSGLCAEDPGGAYLRSYLRERLPEYMVPSAYVSLDVLPRTAAGKVDSAALLTHTIPTEANTNYAAPRNEVETALVAIWQTTLGKRRVGIHDNFFEIGGDSLLSIRLLARANRKGYEIRPVDFVSHPTIAAQAALVVSEKSRTEVRADASAPAPKPSKSEPFDLVNLSTAGLAAIAKQLGESDSGNAETSSPSHQDKDSKDDVFTASQIAQEDWSVSARISTAIHSQMLTKVSEIIANGPEVLSANDNSLLNAAQNVCGNIREEIIISANSLMEKLSVASIPCEFDASSPDLIAPQFHRFSLSIPVDDPTPAVMLLVSLGFWSSQPTNDIHWESFRRSHSSMALTRIDDASTRLDLNWQANSDGSAWRPGPGFLLRHPDRLVRALWVRMNRIIGRPAVPTAHFLGDLLSTPRSLIPHLLEYANVSENDTLVDVGCGDGRMLIEAARRTGCRGIGFETQAGLCKIAREKIRDAQLADSVTIHHDDGWSASLSEATVVFLFIPVRALSSYLPKLFDRLAPGTRVIAHEQVALEEKLKPDRSAPLIADNAVTVAHQWTVS